MDGSTNSDGGSSKSGLSKTAIIGIIVAVVVVALIGLLAWALIAWRRRRAARPPRPAPHNGMPAYQSGPLAGEIDPNVYPTPYSYQSQQPMVNYFDKPGGNPDNAPPPSYITTPVNNGSPGVYKY